MAATLWARGESGTRGVFRRRAVMGACPPAASCSTLKTSWSATSTSLLPPEEPGLWLIHRGHGVLVGTVPPRSWVLRLVIWKSDYIQPAAWRGSPIVVLEALTTSGGVSRHGIPSGRACARRGSRERRAPSERLPELASPQRAPRAAALRPRSARPQPPAQSGRRALGPRLGALHAHR